MEESSQRAHDCEWCLFTLPRKVPGSAHAPPFGHTSPAAPGAHRLAGLLHKLLIPGARALPARMLEPLAPHSIWSVSVCARVPLSHSYAPLPRVGVRATGYALRSSRPATAEVNPRRAAAR